MDYEGLNMSVNGENIFLDSNSIYYLIDALYADNIRTAKIDRMHFEHNVKEMVFPYTRTPYLKFHTPLGPGFKLKIGFIHKADESDNPDICFSCDTGLVLLIKEDCFYDFVQQFRYDSLLEGEFNSVLSFSYWELIRKEYSLFSTGLILSPGIGNEFSGSGLYRLQFE